MIDPATVTVIMPVCGRDRALAEVSIARISELLPGAQLMLWQDPDDPLHQLAVPRALRRRTRRGKTPRRVRLRGRQLADDLTSAIRLADGRRIIRWDADVIAAPAAIDHLLGSAPWAGWASRNPGQPMRGMLWSADRSALLSAGDLPTRIGHMRDLSAYHFAALAALGLTPHLAPGADLHDIDYSVPEVPVAAAYHCGRLSTMAPLHRHRHRPWAARVMAALATTTSRLPPPTDPMPWWVHP